jgi:uncharacterized membrane protein
MVEDARDDAVDARRGPYLRGTPAFDRVVFFSDAVFAIALTLVAVGIGVPVVADRDSNSELWAALLDKIPSLAAYAFTFFWVAFYWRANHVFTTTLKAMSGRYVAAVLLYLAFIALLPFPAATLGEYYNAVAVSFFLVFMAIVSTLEVVLLLVADRDGLFSVPLTDAGRRLAVAGSLSPVVAALLSIPITFVSVSVGVLFFFAASLTLGWLVRRLFPAGPASDPA